ncbi:DUF6880 family protein [Methylocystis silviterrae]|uniref:DUF6880 family protein n=1 Tax=Methylocystis silviterrae TaxID=2743612 RepID=UPI003C78FDB7
MNRSEVVQDVRWSCFEFALDQSRSSRYKHAVRHLLECASLAANVGDFGTHEAFGARIHGKNTSFWSPL